MPQPAAVSAAPEEAIALADAGRHEQALACLREHLMRVPSDAGALHQAGSLLRVLGRFDEAVRHLQRALDALGEPDAPEAQP